MQNFNSLDNHFQVIEFKSVEFLGEYILHPFYRIIYMEYGKFGMVVSGETIVLNAGECAICSMTEQVHLYAEKSIRGYAVIFTEDFLYDTISLKSTVAFLDFFVQNLCTLVKIKKADQNSFRKIWKLFLEIHISKPKYFWTEMLFHNFNLLYYYLSEAYLSRQASLRPKHYSVKTKLVIDFYRKLEANFIDNRKSAFYARELFVSVVHLSRTIKEITGKTLKQIVDEHIIWEAKKLLENNELNITEISDELRFSSLSSFSIFFKKHTGLSPGEFRENLK